MRKLLIQSLLYAFCAMLPSCYTATEFTPKINDAVVEKIEKREEELVMENNFVKQGCQTWLPGKAFAYVDDALSPVLRPEENASLSVTGLKGKTFVYEGYREENLYGNKKLVTLVFRCDSSIYTYATGKSLDEIVAMEYTPLIPSFVDWDEVATARGLFIGKQLYILTNQWYDENDKLFTSRKLVPVTVTAVSPGNSVLPLAVSFVDERGNKGKVFMSVKSSSYTQILTFDRLFSFTDPRTKHTNIGDEAWEAITNGKVITGMTKEECRLALGLPSEVVKIPTYSGLKEQWIYNTGTYLLFSDGLLDAFRQ